MATIPERAEAVMPGGVNSAMRRPERLGLIEIRAAKGSRMWDGEGRVFTDFHGAFGPAEEMHPAVEHGGHVRAEETPGQPERDDQRQ